MTMRGVIVIAAASLGLAGCTSFSSFSLDSLKPAPPTVMVQLDSMPPGADARTSLGPSCKTPCSVPVTAEAGSFTVSYTLNNYMPLTIPVQVTRVPGDFTTPASTSIDPNPVVGELQPAKPMKPAARKMVRKRKPKPAAGAAPDAGTTAFPAPADAPPPPAR
jgi:hypothetical protein